MTSQLLLCVILLGGCKRPSEVMVAGNTNQTYIQYLESYAIQNNNAFGFRSGEPVGLLFPRKCSLYITIKINGDDLEIRREAPTCEEATKLVLERIGKP